jgi:hypothetical protein
VVVATNLLWLGLFGGLVVLMRAPLPWLVVSALCLVAAGWVSAPLATWLVLRKSAWLEPEWRPGRAARVLAALTPLAAIRHLDLLARELVGDLDPLAVGAALLGPRALGVAARPRLVSLRFAAVIPPAGGEADHAWWRQRLLERVSGLLRARDVDPDALFAAPARDDPDMGAWCPSCRAQYRRQSVELRCSNDLCAGVSLVAF